MPELAIVGYGKMGRLIEQLAPDYGFHVNLMLDEFNNANYEGVTAGNFRGIDVAIERGAGEGALLPDSVFEEAGATVVSADGSTRREKFHADRNAPIDCFYVYPTVSLDPGGNASMNAY